MADRVNLTYASAVILETIAERHTYGFEIIDGTGLPSGTVYPALRRMEAARLIESGWDHKAADVSAGPPRKYYRLTSDGRKHLAALRDRYPRLARMSKAK